MLARGRAALGFGVVLALMTLGGNAEMAYHAGLIAAMYAGWLGWHERTGRRDAAETAPRLRRRPLLVGLAASRPGLLALAAATALVLSAVQVLPAIELTRRSGRAASTTARTLYELPEHFGTRERSSFAGTARPVLRTKELRRLVPDGTHWADGLLCRRLEPGTHGRHVYHFSVGPWRLAEYLWPNVSGRQFPVHRRWLDVIRAEGRTWVPSLYMGLFPIVLALTALRLRKGRPRETWLSWLAVLSLVASFGWYGLGWLVHEVQIAAGADPAGPWRVGAPFGGLYWLMTVLLPGYVYFRYPAKLLVIAALALSMLAVRGWDRAFAGRSRRPACAFTWLAEMSLSAAVAVLVVFPFRDQWLGGVEPDVLFGPLDTTGACLDLLFAFVQTAVLCLAGWWLLCRPRRRPRWTQAAALLLVAVDLAVANGWMVACAPAHQWEGRPKLAAAIAREQKCRGERSPYRLFRHPIWLPPSFSTTRSPDRVAEGMQWDRDTLFAKYNLGPRMPLAEVQGTMKPYDYQVLLWAEKQRTGPLFLSKYLILPGGSSRPGLEPIALEGTEAEGLDDVSLWHNPRHLPRAWVVHRAEVLRAPSANDPHEVWRRTREVFFPNGRRRELRESAVVETNTGAAPFCSAEANGPPRAETEKAPVAPRSCCRITRDEPCRVEIEAELDAPGLVVLCDQFYPGWRLEVETPGRPAREVPILRINRVMRGAWIPAGRHRLTYRYRPASVSCGAWLSGLGWLGIVAMALATAAARRRSQRG